MVETALRTRQRVFLLPPFFHRSLWVRAAKADYDRKTSTDDKIQQQESKIMKKRYTETQIVSKLRQADVLIGKGQTVLEV